MENDPQNELKSSRPLHQVRHLVFLHDIEEDDDWQVVRVKATGKVDTKNSRRLTTTKRG